MIEKSFKVIIVEDTNTERVVFTKINFPLTDSKNEKHFCISNFLKPGDLPSNPYEIYWVDDEKDVILIRTWSDLYNYVMYIVPDGEEYVDLFVRSVSESDEATDVSDEENNDLNEE